VKTINDCRLYGILDLSYIKPNECLRVAEAMIEGGVDIVQLRGKKMLISQLVDLAEQIHWITSAGSTPLIVNDHVEVARRVPVEGVHVGQDDESIANVRAAVSYEIIVGKSTHSLEQARAAKKEGADYIGFGPIFATPTKPDYKPIGLTDIKQVHVDLAMPIFCIGGIKRDNLEKVIAAGARRVAIVSGLLKAEDIAKYASEAKRLLLEIEHQTLNIKH
jgi:thiamine-phosphate pyrophosphorylase